VVTGGPKVDKSVLLAPWLARRKAVGDMMPHHFEVGVDSVAGGRGAAGDVCYE
jgi:hypothetical protein